MKESLESLKRMYKEYKKLLKVMRRLYKNGLFLRMKNPLQELENAEQGVDMYRNAIANYKED